MSSLHIRIFLTNGVLRVNIMKYLAVFFICMTYLTFSTEANTATITQHDISKNGDSMQTMTPLPLGAPYPVTFNSATCFDYAYFDIVDSPAIMHFKFTNNSGIIQSQLYNIDRDINFFALISKSGEELDFSMPLTPRRYLLINYNQNCGTVASGVVTVSLTEQSSCAFSFSPNPIHFSGAGGTVSFQINTQDECPWFIDQQPEWISNYSAGSAGSATIPLTAGYNSTGAPRTGAMVINGQTIPVIQDVPTACAMMLDKGDLIFPAEGGSQSLNVTTGENCAWSVSTPAWITATPNGITGNGTVTFTADGNNSGARRHGDVTILGPDMALNIPATQAAPPTCAFTVSPFDLNFPAMGGKRIIFITPSDSACSWTASTDVSWASLFAEPGTQTSAVTISVSKNNVAIPRLGTITIAGHSFVITQAALAGVVTPAVNILLTQ